MIGDRARRDAERLRHFAVRQAVQVRQDEDVAATLGKRSNRTLGRARKLPGFQDGHR